jgi:uncharacterized cupin superfamily protein
MSRRIRNLDELSFLSPGGASAPAGSAAERYGPLVAPVGSELGARMLGYNVVALPPGKAAFPHHSHRANEELFFVLQGTGEVRLGEARHPLRAGDFVACPAGGPESAHQIVNTGDVELRYVAVSTRLSPDVVEYPDSGKYRVLVQGDDPGQAAFDVVGRLDEARDYWDGE